jgi:hypothetical protein
MIIVGGVVEGTQGGNQRRWEEEVRRPLRKTNDK